MTIIHAKDDKGREFSLPITSGATIRNGQKFTISGASGVYRAVANPMSEVEIAIGGRARDMVRRFARTGKRG